MEVGIFSYCDISALKFELMDWTDGCGGPFKLVGFFVEFFDFKMGTEVSGIVNTVASEIIGNPEAFFIVGLSINLGQICEVSFKWRNAVGNFQCVCHRSNVQE